MQNLSQVYMFVFLKKTMAKISASFLFSIFFVLFISVLQHQTRACELTTIGGGCPNLNACLQVCRPCFRGVGVVSASCRSGGGGLPYDECVCTFKNGAPCPPIGPPRCPGPWPPQDAGAGTYGPQHVVILNQTHAVIGGSP